MKKCFATLAVCSLSGLLPLFGAAEKAQPCGGAGMLVSPRSGKGEVSFVNAQSAVDHSVFETVAANWKKLTRLNITVTKGSPVSVKTASAVAAKSKANLVLFIIDDSDLGTSIIYAPETKWCILNVSAILSEKPSEKELRARAMKETTRAFALLVGAMGSGYPNSLMSAVSSPKELDLNPEEWRVPVDVMERFKGCCMAHGIKPYRIVPYRKACEEGWAHAPTNDIQKAIWDKVHQLPNKPIKILPETKKVKE